MTPQQGKKFIFISYSHKDSGIVLPLIQGLRARNFNVWYDDNIEAGSEWPECIATNLLASESVIVFMSRNADASHNCHKELTYAINKRKTMIVVYLEDFQPTSGTALQISDLQVLYRSNYSNDDALLDALFNDSMLRPCLNSAAPTGTSASARNAAAPSAPEAGNAVEKDPPSSPHPTHRKTAPVLFLSICIAYLAYGYLTGRTIFLFYHSRSWYTFLRCVSDALFAFLVSRLALKCVTKNLEHLFPSLFKTQIYCMILCPIISISVGGIFLDPSEGYWFNFCVSFLITIFPSLASFLGLITGAEKFTSK